MACSNVCLLPLRCGAFFADGSVRAGEAEKPVLTPLRPKVNSLFHLFGDWLFEAALVGTDAPATAVPPPQAPPSSAAPYPSVSRPIPHGIDLPVPRHPEKYQQDSEEEINSMKIDYNEPTTSQSSQFVGNNISCDEPHSLDFFPSNCSDIRGTSYISQWDGPIALRTAIHGAFLKSFDTPGRLECSRRSGRRPRAVTTQHVACYVVCRTL
ncbi:hypothetical protein EVAR_86311_1 [Eumeta japonica]|uniref:Uncharacterized protein n=1 Tax=Eumeta variegata TaxID=151549 RepID=A0A4C1X708_EUMVA|nr:hypothetical protein EVAR_86311_1 [Eumeta japonica]